MTKKHDSLTEAHLHVREILDRLKAISISVEYEGSGDSGMWEIGLIELADGREAYLEGHTSHAGPDPVLLPNDKLSNIKTTEESFVAGQGWVTKSIIASLTYAELINNLVGRALGSYCGGWENNEGARGTITITHELVELEHTYYETVSHEETYAFKNPLPAAEKMARLLTNPRSVYDSEDELLPE